MSTRAGEEEYGNVVRLPIARPDVEVEKTIEPTRVWAPQRTVDLVVRRVETFRHSNHRKGLLRRAVRATGASAKYGSIGLGRTAATYWTWVTAIEHVAKASSETVETVRKRRRTASLWVAGGGVIGDAVLANAYGLPLWAAPAALLAAAAGIGGLAAYAKQAKPGTDDGEGRAIGTHPGAKAVRKLFVAAKVAKKVEDVRVLAPGVIRDGNKAWTCTVELPDGVTYDEALVKRPKFAAAGGMGISRMYLDPVPDHHGRVQLWSPDRDPLAGPKVDCSLIGRTAPVDVWTERVPMGLTVRGEPLGFSMAGRSLLVGGEPEAGKSVACNILLCFAALDPSVDLWLADGKGVDLLDYEDLAYRAMLRPDPQALLDMINESREDMEERGAQLAKLRVKKLTKELAQDLGWSMSLLHIDELAYFTTSDLGKQINAALRDHVSRGRYVGKFTSAATQRPGSEVVDTGFRDLLSIRLAMRCTTPEASDMILGRGWASRGYNAQLIDPMQRGAGLLFAEGTRPVTGRTGFLDDPDITRLSRVAYGLRQAAGTLPMSEDSPQRRLLRACLDVMAEADRMWTCDLLPRVQRVPEFAELDEMKLASRLAECRPEVKPAALWLADEAGTKRSRNGYVRADLVAALERRR